MSSSSLSARVDRAASVLRAVLQINRLLGETPDLDPVLGRALDEMLAIYPQAEFGFILTEDPDGRLRTRATRHRDHPDGSDDPISLSRTVLDHVMREGKGLIISDTELDGGPTLTDSFNVTGIRTALCVPVLGREGRAIGIIQLDSRRKHVSFGQEDLELLAAVSVPIGVVVENHRLLKERASLVAAAEVQSALLPRRRPAAPGYATWEFYQPALEVGGDYYDYIPIELDNGGGTDCEGQGQGEGEDAAWLRWGVALGDVCGKGMPAALLMAKLSAEARFLVRAGARPRRGRRAAQPRPV